jgi:hypothetical protein
VVSVTRLTTLMLALLAAAMLIGLLYALNLGSPY